MISIKDIIVKEEKTVWIKYIDEFEIQIRFLSRPELSKLVEKSREYIWDKKDHMKIEKMNSDVFYNKFVDTVIVDWKGLTGETLKKMISVKVDDPNIEIPFSKENAIELLKNAYDFDVFIQNQALDIEKFEEEVKKS